MRKKTSTIYERIIFVHIIAIIVIMAVNGFISYRIIWSREVERMDREIEQISSRLAFQISLPFWNLDENVVKNLLLQEIKNPYLSGIVVLQDGKLWTGVAANRQSEIHALSGRNNENTENLDGKEKPKIKIYHEDNSGKNWELGELVIYTTDESIQTMLSKLLFQTIIQALALIIGLSFFTVILLNMILKKPIEQITGIARRIGEGEIWLKAEVCGPREIMTLATAFNTMTFRLRESLDELDRYFSSSLDLLCICDIKGVFRRLNREWETTLGYPVSELIGRNFMDFVYSEDIDRTVEELEKLGRNERVHNFVNRYLHKDGSYRWIEWRSFPYGKDIYAVARDISDRKRSEEALLESEKKYRQLVDNSHDIIYTLNADGVFTFVSPAWTRILGHAPGEVEGHSFTEFVYPDDLPACYAILRKLMDSGEPQEEVEYRVRHADGSWRWHTSSACPVRDSMGNVTQFGGIARDITERKQAEDALRESEKQFKTLFELAPYECTVIGQDGRYLMVNRAHCESFALDASEIIGRTPDELGIITDAEVRQKIRTDLKQKGAVDSMELTIRNRAGDVRNVMLSGQRIEFAGKPATLSITIDISEIKRIQAAIDAKNKELEQIVYVASHDLRSPLVNVDGFSRELDYSLKELARMLDIGQDCAELKKTLQTELPEMEKSIIRIRTSARQMDNLLKGLLKLSRSGRAALQIADIDMNELIAQLSSTFAFRLQEAGIELVVDSLPSCRGDAVQITQVFSNLLDNAIKYLDTERSGRIHVRGAIENGRAVYRVEDNGIGIAQNHLEHVFELFHRLEPGKTEGEGLGLTIARQSLGRMDGEIRVESHPGKGSIFTVCLPPDRKKTNT